MTLNSVLGFGNGKHPTLFHPRSTPPSGNQFLPKWHSDSNVISCWAADVSGNTVGGEQGSVLLIINNRDMIITDSHDLLMVSMILSVPPYMHASYLTFTASVPVRSHGRDNLYHYRYRHFSVQLFSQFPISFLYGHMYLPHWRRKKFFSWQFQEN